MNNNNKMNSDNSNNNKMDNNNKIKLKVPEKWKSQARNVYPTLNEIQLFWSNIKSLKGNKK